MFWLYKVFSLQAVSNFIGVIEIAVAVLIALRPFSARLSFIGSIGAIITFLLTVSFLLSTPGAIQFSHGFLLLGDAGQFLVKDLVLLGASIWTAAETRNGDQFPESPCATWPPCFAQMPSLIDRRTESRVSLELTLHR
jgi:reactive chlorine resistance protein C